MPDEPVKAAEPTKSNSAAMKSTAYIVDGNGASAMSHRDRRQNPDAIRHAFETGEYPYKTRLNDAQYLKHMGMLQVELLKGQNWVKETGQKIVVLFEGRMQQVKAAPLSVSWNI